jgi:hypothetical protein
VINNLFDRRYALWLDLEPAAAPPASLPLSAAEALRALEEGYEVTRGYISALTEDQVTEAMGPIAGPWEGGQKLGYVLHMLDEFIHHSAEIALLRDLYRAQAPANPVVDALLTGELGKVEEALEACPQGIERAQAERADLLLQAAAQARWEAVPTLVDHGFPLSLANGCSALHYASAAGNLDAVRLLLDAGADAALRDSIYRATPAEWADYFNQPATAEFLRNEGQLGT